jgi:hypothetical protein
MVFVLLATMQTFKGLLIAVAAISVHIATVEACISATTDLDGRSAPTSNATRTTDVYLTGDCIDGKRKIKGSMELYTVLTIILVSVKCQAIGDTLYGSNVWDYGE